MDVEKITVLGSGTMGHGIAQVAATAGFTVTLYDVAPEFLAKATATITNNIDKFFVAKGKMTREEGDAILGRIHTSTDLAQAAKDADMVIEAIPENLELKKSTFAELDKCCPPHTILASNTSVLPVTAIAGATKRPEKCIGTHFFNPAAVMKLVEVVLPLGVADETVQTVIAVCQKMGKTPIKFNIPEAEAVDRLVDLIKEHGQWVDPEPA